MNCVNFILWFVAVVAKQSTLVCQFASPLDVDTHNKPEVMSSGTLLLVSF